MPLSLFLPLFHGSQLSNEAGACIWPGNGKHRDKSRLRRERGDARERACKPACARACGWVREPSRRRHAGEQTTRAAGSAGGFAACNGQGIFRAGVGTSPQAPGPSLSRNVPVRVGRTSERESEPAASRKERSHANGGGRSGKRQGLVSPRREQTCRGGMLRPRSSARSWLRGRCSLSPSIRSHRAWAVGGAEAVAVPVFHVELHVAQNPTAFLARGSQVERTIKSRRRGAGRDGPERMQRMELISCPGGTLELFDLSSTPSPPSQRQTQ